MTITEKALRLRAQIEVNAASMDDEEAAEYVELSPKWSGDGVFYPAGFRATQRGVLYKCLAEHVSQPGWSPEDTPSLWAKILPGQDGTDIGPWERPDSTNPYMTGDRVIFDGYIQESTIDNNIWSPAEYPAGWKIIGPYTGA